jgi:hypothetical protein
MLCSFALGLLIALRLFSKCIHTRSEPDWHVARYIFVVGRHVIRVRELVEDDENQNRRICCAIEIMPKILIKLSVSTEKEALTIVCKEGAEHFAQDLAYWVLEKQALHFDVRSVTDEEYEQISVVPEA